MPELPEVETIVRGLQKRIIGKTISGVEVLHPKPLGQTTPKELERFVRSQVFRKVERFGKYIHMQFASGKSLVCHLRMTGKYIYSSANVTKAEERRHIRIIFHFSDQSCLLYKDLRIFGTIKLYADGVTIAEKAKQGREPLSPALTTAYLLEKARRRQVAIKILLLDQSVIAGLGNIYVCEILFRARVSPFLSARDLSSAQAARIIEATREVIKLAIKNNGTSVSDFRNVDDKEGKFQNMLLVYQKTGAACAHCTGGIIQREKQGQRSTFFCPVCQV